MSSPAITVHQDATVREAGDQLARHGISALPVIDDEGRLVGIVSQMDLIRFDTTKVGVRVGAAGPESEPSRVIDIMTRQVITVDEDTDLHTVAQRLSESHVRQMPVMAGSEVTGVVSRRDLIKWMARSDAALTLDVVALLEEEARRLANLRVAVHDGVAHIEGQARPDTLSLAANLARAVPGVMDATVTSKDR